MINIEQRSLSAFHDHVLAARKRVRDYLVCRPYVLADLIRPSLCLSQNLVDIQRLATVDFGDEFVFELDDRRQGDHQLFKVQQLTNSDSHARNFVNVRGSDSTPSGANRSRATTLLFQLVEQDVVRHDEMRTVGNSDLTR